MESFENALMDLIDRHLAAGADRDEVISALELRIMAMNEESDEVED